MSKIKTYTSDDVLAMCKEYMNEKHIQFIEKAIYFATFAHKEQVRKSGEAYIVHPIQVAGILAELSWILILLQQGFFMMSLKIQGLVSMILSMSLEKM